MDLLYLPSETFTRQQEHAQKSLRDPRGAQTLRMFRLSPIKIIAAQHGCHHDLRARDLIQPCSIES